MIEPVGAKPHKIDAGGRLKLREEQRKALGSSVVMACGFDNCITIFTPEAWQRYVEDFAALGAQDPDAHDLRRMLISTAELCEIDAQGRTKIPDFLMRWAGLGGEGKLQAYLIKVDEGRWECWEAGRWQEFLTVRAQELKRVASSFWGAGRAPREP